MYVQKIRGAAFLRGVLTIRPVSADAVAMVNPRFAWAAVAAALSGGALLSAVSAANAAEPPEPPVGDSGREGDYLRHIHERVHPAWVDGFIRISPYKQLGPVTSERFTEISINLRWDGTVESMEISKPSGLPEFDTAAMNVISSAGPFPPPVDVLADDGLAHLKWRFARNHRLCSGAEVVHVEFPLQIALPNLALRGQLSEALRRMNAELARVGWTGGDFVTPFARQWLGRSHLSSELDARAAAALALGGDRQQVAFLKSALSLPQTASIAAVALERMGIDVGALLAKELGGEGGDASRPAVIAALRAAPSVLAGCSACVSALAAAALDPRQPLAARLEMIQMLGRVDRTEVINQALGHAAKDNNAAVRGAALLAQIQRGSGRVALIRMSALLRDKAPEIRAAAAAGVLRAGGDQGIEQLYLLGREKDPRPLIAVAAELGQMSSQGSLALLANLLKRSDKVVRLATIRALAARRDPGATAMVAPILAAARANASEDVAVRELAMVAASPEELVGISADTLLGPLSYRALLRANLRQEAAQWLLVNLEQLSPEDRISALGDWIAEVPKYAAQK